LRDPAIAVPVTVVMMMVKGCMVVVVLVMVAVGTQIVLGVLELKNWNLSQIKAFVITLL
jgi:hypothetical protein